MEMSDTSDKSGKPQIKKRNPDKSLRIELESEDNTKT